MNRRNFLYTLPALSACSRRGNEIEGRWEGKLTNGQSAMTINFDFHQQPDKSFDLRVTCRDLLLMTQLIQTWKLEGASFNCTLPLVEGPRNYTGHFGGPTFDLEYKPAQEKIHLLHLGSVPTPPYRESGPLDLIPTQRSIRGTAQIFSKDPTFGHFNADLLAKLGISTSSKPAANAGWVFTEDMPVPTAPKTDSPKFLMLLSPSYERIPQIASYQCPIFVLLGEADTRNDKLERGTRQIAFDLREALTKQNRKDYQISVIPQADQTFRIPAAGRQFARLTPGHIDHFRRFLARFEPSTSASKA